MLVCIFVNNLRRLGIKRGIDVNTLHLFPIPFLQQIQRLKILRMNQHTIALLIEVFDCSKQPGFKHLFKETGIQHQFVIRLQELEYNEQTLSFALEFGYDPIIVAVTRKLAADALRDEAIDPVV